MDSKLNLKKEIDIILVFDFYLGLMRRLVIISHYSDVKVMEHGDYHPSWLELGMPYWIKDHHHIESSITHQTQKSAIVRTIHYSYLLQGIFPNF